MSIKHYLSTIGGWTVIALSAGLLGIGLAASGASVWWVGLPAWLALLIPFWARPRAFIVPVEDENAPKPMQDAAVAYAALVAEETATGREELERSRALLDDAIHRLTASFTQMANGARQQRSIALETLGGSQQGPSQLDTLLEDIGRTVSMFDHQIDSASEAAQRINQGMGEIAQQVSGMNEILTGLNTIAQKTHFLSLNANIEAARAGEAGRGFVVVAEEVLKLADYTRAFSEQIRQRMRAVHLAIDSMSQIVAQLSRSDANMANDARQQIGRTSDELRRVHHDKLDSLRQLSELAQETEEGIADATMALQFQDMLNQLLGHAQNRLNQLQNLSQTARPVLEQRCPDDGALADLRAAMQVAPTRVEHNPVAQRSVQHGELELF